MPDQDATPEQVRAAWEFLTGVPAEEVNRASAELGRKIGKQEHPLAGVLSITITASGTLTVEPRPDGPSTVSAPAAVVAAASRPVMDTETAMAIVVVWLAFLQASSALAEDSMADFYAGILASLPGLLLLWKTR